MPASTSARRLSSRSTSTFNLFATRPSRAAGRTSRRCHLFRSLRRAAEKTRPQPQSRDRARGRRRRRGRPDRRQHRAHGRERQRGRQRRRRPPSRARRPQPVALVAGIPQSGWYSASPTPRCGWSSSRTSSARSARSYNDEGVARDRERVRTTRPGQARLPRPRVPRARLAEGAADLARRRAPEQALGGRRALLREPGRRELGLGDRRAGRRDPRGRARTRRRQGQGRRGQRRCDRPGHGCIQAEATELEVAGTPWFFIGIGDQPPYRIEPRATRRASSARSSTTPSGVTLEQRPGRSAPRGYWL